MRQSCLECVAKHLGSAAVYIEEVAMGYPNYFGFAYGELNHAALESFEEFPELAWAIREHRIKWAETRKQKTPHRIPFEALFAYIDVMLDIGDGEIEPSPEIYAGLACGEDGHPEFHMDTRPDAVPDSRSVATPQEGAKALVSEPRSDVTEQDVTNYAKTGVPPPSIVTLENLSKEKKEKKK